MLLIRPDAAQRVTVLGSTRKSAATSPGVSRRSLLSSTIIRLSYPCPLSPSVPTNMSLHPVFRKKCHSQHRDRSGTRHLGSTIRDPYRAFVACSRAPGGDWGLGGETGPLTPVKANVWPAVRTPTGGRLGRSRRVVGCLNSCRPRKSPPPPPASREWRCVPPWWLSPASRC